MMPDTTVTLEEGERQATILALAVLALHRPGWNDMLREIADKLQDCQMFDKMKEYNMDRIKPD
jgi:hypothetical protein